MRRLVLKLKWVNEGVTLSKKNFTLVVLGLIPCEDVYGVVAVRNDPQRWMTGVLAEVAEKKAIEAAASRKMRRRTVGQDGSQRTAIVR